MTSEGSPPPPPPGPWQAPGQYPPAPAPPPPYYPAPAYAVQLHPGPAPGVGYAGFWIRFLAAIIDGIIVGVPLAIIFFAVEGDAIRSYSDCLNTAIASGALATTCGSTFEGSVAGFQLLDLGVSFVYFVFLWSMLGGTLGQRLLGLRVVDAATGRRIGIGRAIGRYIGYLISSFALLIGLIWAAFDPRKQGWHDKIASTFVVRNV